jgi:hypothetical protein
MRKGQEKSSILTKQMSNLVFECLMRCCVIVVPEHVVVHVHSHSLVNSQGPGPAEFPGTLGIPHGNPNIE